MSRKGAGTSSLTINPPAKKKRIAKRMRQEEAMWRSKNGPVVVTYKEPKSDAQP